jgi:hypothetical protein
MKFGGSSPNHMGEFWPPKLPNANIDPEGENVHINEREYYWDFVKGDVDSININE